MSSSQESHQNSQIKKLALKCRGSPSCLWPLDRLSPEPVFWVLFHDDDVAFLSMINMDCYVCWDCIKAKELNHLFGINHQS
jgi:hypothetical protein